MCLVSFKYSLHSYSWMCFSVVVTLSVNLVDERILIQGRRAVNSAATAASLEWTKKKLMF